MTFFSVREARTPAQYELGDIVVLGGKGRAEGRIVACHKPYEHLDEYLKTYQMEDEVASMVEQRDERMKILDWKGRILAAARELNLSDHDLTLITSHLARSYWTYDVALSTLLAEGWEEKRATIPQVPEHQIVGLVSRKQKPPEGEE